MGDGGGVRVLGGGELSLALGLGPGFGGAVEKGGQDGPVVVAQRFPGPFGGVAAMVSEADHGGGRPYGETQEHNMNGRLRATECCG